MAEQMVQDKASGMAATQTIPTGYKLTEVGVIPEDWEVFQLGDLSDFVTSGSRGWAKYYSTSGALFIRSQNVRDGKLCFMDSQHVNIPQGIEGGRTKVKLNDLLVTITGNSVGNVALASQEFEEAYISQHVGLVRLKDSSIGSYVCRYLSPNAPGNLQIQESQSGQSKPGLNLQNLKDFLVAVPKSKEEAKKITSALDATEALIVSLEQLIAKKQAIKTAAMQQLLTGRTRLPPFSKRSDGTPKGYKQSELGQIPEDWEVVPLGDICGLYQPVTISGSELKESGYPVYGANGLIGFYEKYNHGESQVIVTCRGSTCGTVNYTVAKSWITGNAMVVDVDKSKKLDKNFTYYMLVHQDLTVCITGSGQPQIVRSPLAAFKVAFPKIEEQTAIAIILSDMDSELNALEQKLAKARDVKQGMMQQLLTGRIRLPLPQEA